MPKTELRVPQSPKLCFIYNHDAPHQVAHTAPVVNALAGLDTEIDISIVYSNELIKRNICRHLSPEAIDRVQFKRLAYPWFLHGLDFLNKIIPFTRLMNLIWNRKLFKKFDFLVTSERTSLMLKTHLGIKKLRFLLIPHGAGDRSVAFRKNAQKFELILTAGEKTRQRYIEDAGAEPERVEVFGYPKFDAFFDGSNQLKKVFENDNPIVLYNPHFDPSLSSWYENGLGILEFFKNNPDYNLIVAPHIMLFKKKVHASVEHGRKGVRKDIPAEYYNCPNIHIDVDSENLIDMTYTKMADVYIGDASSQIYEFIYNPRPAIFLRNKHLTDWENDRSFRHWKLGVVADEINGFKSTLSKAQEEFKVKYKGEQMQAFQETFENVDGKASLRAAKIISSHIQRPSH